MADTKKLVLLDVMVNGRFYCQVKYFGIGHPEIIDGKIEMVYDIEELERFVREQRPSLNSKVFNIQFSSNRV